MTDRIEEVKAILEEPNISSYDWEIGKTILANWKAGLPQRICQLFEAEIQHLKEDIERIKGVKDD